MFYILDLGCYKLMKKMKIVIVKLEFILNVNVDMLLLLIVDDYVWVIWLLKRIFMYMVKKDWL